MAHIVEQMTPVSILNPQTTDGGPETDYLDMRDCHTAYLVVNLTQAAAHETTITVQEAEDGTGTGVGTVANNVRIWSDVDVDDDGETLDRRTDGNNYSVPNEDDNMLVVFQVNAAALSGDNTHIRLTFQDSSQATNFASVVAYKQARYSA